MSDGQRKAPSAKNNLNHDMSDFLMELSAYERTVSRNLFKSNAYKSAASALAAHPTRVKSGKEASAIKGIGKKIAEKIDEFLATGKLKKLEKIRTDDVSIGLTELSRVSGIGPAKARQLYDAGITDLDSLARNTDQLNHHQLIGLKHLDEFERRIPRAEVGLIEARLRQALASLDTRYALTVCGSYRRGSEKSGDVDALITYNAASLQQLDSASSGAQKSEKTSPNGHKISAKSNKTSHEVQKTPTKSSKRKDMSDSSSDEEEDVKDDRKKIKNYSKGSSSSKEDKKHSPVKKAKNNHREMLQEVVRQLEQDDLVTDTLSLGDTKFMGVCRLDDTSLHRRLDIRLLAPGHYYCGVLYFTGSDLFNKDMRAKALTAGFTLNEYSLRPVGSTGVPGEPLPVESEQDVFDYIGLKYRKPQDRNVL